MLGVNRRGGKQLEPSDFAGGLLRISIATGGTTVAASATRVTPPAFQTNVSNQRAQVKPDDSFELSLRERSIKELTPLIPAARKAKATGGGRFNMQASAP